MKRISVYLTEKQIDRLNQLADDTDITVSRHIRNAIDEYLYIGELSNATLGYKANLHYVPQDVFLGQESDEHISKVNNNIVIPLSSIPPQKTNNY